MLQHPFTSKIISPRSRSVLLEATGVSLNNVSLNILIIRLLFCVCVHVTGIFQKHSVTEACRLCSGLAVSALVSQWASTVLAFQSFSFL